MELKNTNDLEENKGYKLIEQGKYPEAIEYSDKALESNPEDNKAWNIKGRALKELGRYQESVECYNKSRK